jgi:hypothetical protein
MFRKGSLLDAWAVTGFNWRLAYVGGMPPLALYEARTVYSEPIIRL